MRRTVLTWVIFSAALVLVLTVMAFFTVRIVQFERREAAADARASVEERIRLALWRMDSLAAAMLPAKQNPRGNSNPYSNTFRDNNMAQNTQRRSDPQFQSQMSVQEYQQRELISPPAPTNWKPLEKDLLACISDLLPDARLVSIEKTCVAPDDTRRLASIPAQLVVPASAFDPLPLPWNTPLRISLMVAWSCALVASAAVAMLLRGALVLSARRGAFVSAVTHELRTPLTTFKMYSEMLAGGMVADPASRQQYLDTLVSESDRLGRLIENVLAYARLERQLSPARAQSISIGDLLDRALPGLRRRCQQAELPFDVRISPETAARTCATDNIAVQQILLNLVDNACKYGRSSIELAVDVIDQRMEFRVTDKGPGLDPAASARLFHAFSKSKTDAVPGIGLGLFLSRRLARDLGGDLRHVSVSPGTMFVLTLPVAP